MKYFEEELVDKDEILNIVKKILNTEDKYNNHSIKDLEKIYPEKIEKLAEALLEYMGENDLKF